MKRIHRSSSPRAIRLISFALCYALIVTTAFLPLSPTAIAGAQGGNLAAASSSSLVQPGGLLGTPGRFWASLMTLLQGGGLPNVPGPNLPNLDAMKVVQFMDPVAPAAIPSGQACQDCTPCPTCGPGGANHAPVVKAGGPYFGTVGTPLVVNGLGSFDIDPGDGISVYAWTFGDGPSVFNGPMPNHTYSTPGNRTISLTVTDRHNATSTVTTTVSVTATQSTMPPVQMTQGNGAHFIGQSVPTSMTAGESYAVSVTMLNTGTTTWSRAHLYRLGSQSPKDNSNWGTARVYLPTEVPPGSGVTFNFSVVAPFSGDREPQPVPFHWGMVQDGVASFGESTTEQSVTIISNYQSSEGDAPYVNPFPDLFASRIAVQHRTGGPGEDLLSGNYNWGLGLVTLAGRSGLDLNLGLSYNSLAAWTKVNPPQADPDSKSEQSSSFTFDTDRGFPSVGFRMGFPTIQGPFSNSQTSGSSYLMLLPSGARVEFRQVGSTNVYEAADSSYSQLLDGGNGSLLMRTTDGSQLAYWSINSEYRCTEAKDRNGNYLTIKYDPINGTANLGRMTSITDTLGRTLNFNYDANYRLQSISQPRNGQTPHVWATFGYTDKPIETNFNDSVHSAGQEEQMEQVATQRGWAATLGLPEDNLVSVLTQVGLDDGSRYNFDYTSWGQVYRIKHFAADGHQLNYTSYNLPVDASAAQNDCPRFSQRQDGVENWNNNSAAFTNFEIDPNGTWGQVTTAVGTADQVTYKEYSTTEYTDWRRGLVTRTEIYTPESTTPKKTTITDWTQDDPNLAYPLNPRVTTATISDAEGKRRRTTIEYTAFGLPSDVYEMGPYETNDWRTLRRTHTDYNLAAPYINRRIIGLVAGQYLFAPDAPNSNSVQTLLSKTTREYDAYIGWCGGEICVDGNGQQHQSTEINAPPGGGNSVIQHDANFGQSFVVGRGDLTRVTRWDVDHEMGGGTLLTSILKYNTLGSVIVTGDPSGHWTWISYADSFSNDGMTDNSIPYLTMAYPTGVTDPDGYASTVKYNYDLGVASRTQDPKGAAQTTEYDSAGRVKRVTNAVNGAYTRFVYPLSQTIVNKFTTINELTIETYTATVFDGAGRVRAVAGDFPNSTGHYSGQFTFYDQQGRAVQSTNPTEMTHVWAAAGPEDQVGWYSSSQTYDWKGRPLITTNPSITSNPAETTTKQASYDGCGCAGGAVVTLTDEGSLVDIDPGAGITNVVKKRQQKIYSDALGRTVKTEVLNWDGAEPFSVYSTIVNTYNARDQVTSVREYQGTEASGVYHETSMTYDGYGRLKTKHVPEQQAYVSGSTDHTTWEYNPDDTVQTVTDARGITTTFGYNARSLLTSIAYPQNLPAGVPATANVTYAYDAAGNRSSMSDASGNAVSYDYDTLSRLRSEARQFSGLTGTYTLAYEYNLVGQVNKVMDQSPGVGTSFSYTLDNVGRLTSVDSTGLGATAPLASNAQYRASGALKHRDSGNGTGMNLAYNSRGMVTQYSVSGLAGRAEGSDYEYHPDGRVKFASDFYGRQFSSISAHDKSYEYDQVGRLQKALTGLMANDYLNGSASSQFPASGSYMQVTSYDEWDNLVGRFALYWTEIEDTEGTFGANNRNADWAYDADGRVISMNEPPFNEFPYVAPFHTYDAAGRHVKNTQTTSQENPTPNQPVLTKVETVDSTYDGDGQQIMRVDTSQIN